MKSVLKVFSLILLATVGATTGDDTQGQGAEPEGQQQVYQQYGPTAPNNGMDPNMLMMVVINQMNKVINLLSMIKKDGDPIVEPPMKQLRNSTECGVASIKQKIVGGAESENVIPWQCNFYASDDTWYGCGGTIINCDPTIIVTSAFCVAYKTPAKVTCGDWKIDATDANEHTLEVTGVTLHPKYDGFGNDIAVVRVKGTMPCSKGKIWPACLPNKEHTYTYVGWADTMVSGWGAINSNYDITNTLKVVNAPPVSDDICQSNTEEDFVPKEMMCAGTAGKGVCDGDEGSPLVTRAEGDSGYSLIGIVSWEWGCADSPEPYAVYTKFATYLKWVADQFELEVTTISYND